MNQRTRNLYTHRAGFAGKANMVHTDKAPITEGVDHGSPTANRIFGDKELWDIRLSDHELNSLAHQLKIPHYLGAVSRNKMRGKPRNKESYILNTEHSTKGNGEHWVAVIKDHDEVYYFNSYGTGPVNDVTERYKDYDIDHNEYSFQGKKNGSVYCGMISLYVLFSYWRHTRDFMKTLNDIKQRRL